MSRFILKLFLETWAFCACNVFCSHIFIFSLFVKAAFFHSFLALHGSRSVKERNEKSGLAKHKMLQSIFSLCVPLYAGVSSCSSVDICILFSPRCCLVVMVVGDFKIF